MRAIAGALAWVLATYHPAVSQSIWDGGGGDSLWQNPRNWSSDEVPLTGEEVLLDNSVVKTGYSVVLPSGNTGVSIARLRIQPSAGLSIRLLLPGSNTATPALRLTGTGECLFLSAGAVFVNASGAASGDPIAFSGGFHLGDGATYVHNTVRGHTRVVERLSQKPGTEKGVFLFDVPGTSAYAVSLSGRTFGTFVLSAAAAGGSRRYNGSGSNPLTVRGGMRIGKGAFFSTTQTSDIRLEGGLLLDGTLSIGPASSGAIGRSLVLTGRDTSSVAGEGSLTLLANFRNIVADSGTFVCLQRDIALPSEQHSFLLKRNASLHLGESVLSGSGRFSSEASSTLFIGSAGGLRHSDGTGNVRTSSFEPDSGTAFVFVRDGEQRTGDGLPTRIAILKVDKPSGRLVLSRHTEVAVALHLTSGIVQSTADATLTLTGARLSSPTNGYGDSDGGWEGGFVEGPMRRLSNDTGILIFPIGKGSVFAPVKVWRAYPGDIAFVAEYHPKPYENLEPVSNPPLAKVSRYEHWTVRNEGGPSNPASQVALSWRSAYGGRSEWRDSLRVAHFADDGPRPQWEPFGEGAYITGTDNRGYARSDRAADRFGVLTLASASPYAVLDLPVTRLYSRMADGMVHLSWESPPIPACRGCDIERSRDGSAYVTLQPVGCPGPTGSLSRGFIDGKPMEGRNFYRVACRLERGERVLSNVAVQTWSRKAGIRIHPNPASGLLVVEGPSSEEKATLHVSDMRGVNVIPKRTWLGNREELDLTGLPAGIFLLHWQNGTKSSRIPFLKR